MTSQDYLVRFGLAGDIARFRAGPSANPLSRGAAVVMRTRRGVELGEVVRAATDRHARLQPEPEGGGEILRPAGVDDLALAEAMGRRAGAFLARGSELIEQMGLPMTLLDAEVLLDGEHAHAQHLVWAPCDVRELVRPLSRELGLIVNLVDVGRPVPAQRDDDHGCGDCGSGGGGCGSGGCGGSGGGGCGSSCGSVTPEEVRAYFAELREKVMERRVPLL